MQTPRLILVATVGVLLAMSVGVNGGSIFDIVNSIVTGTTTAVGSSVSAVTGIVNGVVGETTTFIQNVVANVLNGAEAVATAIAAPLVDAVRQGLNTLSGIRNATTNALNSISSQLMTQARQASTILNSGARNAITNAIQTVNGTISTARDIAANGTAAVSDALKSVVADVTANLTASIQALNNTGMDAGKCLSGVMNNVNSTLRNLSDTQARDMQNASNILMQLASNALKGVSDATAAAPLACLLPPFNCATQLVSKHIAGPLRDLAAFTELFAQGVQQQMNATRAAGANLMNQIQNATNSCNATASSPANATSSSPTDTSSSSPANATSSSPTDTSSSSPANATSSSPADTTTNTNSTA